MSIDAAAAALASTSITPAPATPAPVAPAPAAPPPRPLDVWVNLTPDGGVRKLLKVAGTGASCASVKRVKVSYEGRVEGGGIFDSSAGYGAVLELASCVSGFSTGVASLRVGDVAEIAMTPKYGYGTKPVVGIPPNSSLVFSITVLEAGAMSNSGGGGLAPVVPFTPEELAARKEAAVARVAANAERDARKAAALERSAALAAKLAGGGKKGGGGKKEKPEKVAAGGAAAAPTK